jgi:hypothetical protein
MLTLKRHAALALSLAALAAGCATPDKVYESTAEKNLHITAKSAGNSFATVKATFLYVYVLTPECKLDYLGHVLVNAPVVDVGLPTGKPLVLTAEFAKAGRFDHGGVRNSYSYLVQPRPGYAYAAEIVHDEQFHKFALAEGRRGGPMRALERKSAEGCTQK